MSQNSKYDPSIHEILKHQNWEEILAAVLKFAVAKSKKFQWLGYKVEPEELVQEAIARAYGVGKKGTYRNWNRSAYPRLENFLNSIINSMVSHDADHAGDFPEETLFNENGSVKIIKLRSDGKGYADAFNPTSPEETYIGSENLKEIADHLKSVAKGDEEMEMVVLCLEDGIGRPRDIAEETGYQVEKIYRIINRLRQRLIKINPK